MTLNPEQDAYNLIRLRLLAGIATADVSAIALALGTTGKLNLQAAHPELLHAIPGIIGGAEEAIGSPIFNALVGAATGIADLGAPGSQEATAVAIIKRAIGFGVGLPLAAGQVEIPLRALLGDHLGKTLFEALKDIPNEMGVNFFLGTVLERIFITAVGTPLEEAIATRTRPARFGYREIRQLQKAHALTHEKALEEYAAAGYRDADIALMSELDRTFLSLSDLQQAFLQGVKDEAEIRDYLGVLGVREDDASTLIDLYLRRAETAGGDFLHSVARSQYVQGNLSKARYLAVLEEINVPPASAARELEAIELELSTHHHQLTVGEVKALYLAGHLSDREARFRLAQLGYEEADADLLIGSWVKTKAAGHPGLTQAVVLAYYKSGVLNREQSYGFLIDMGMHPADAALILDHPLGQAGGYKFPLTPATLVGAYLDGVLQSDDLKTQLEALGMDPREVGFTVQAAILKRMRGPIARAPHKALSEAQVLEAFRLSLVSETYAVRQLGLMGYEAGDAQLLIAIEHTKIAGKPPPDWSIAP